MADFLRSKLWVWPLLFAALLAGFGGYALIVLEATIREQVRGQLQATLDTAAAGLEIWADENEAVNRIVARNPQVVAAIRQLVLASQQHGEARAATIAGDTIKTLTARAQAFVEEDHFQGWSVLTRSGFILANMNPKLVGRTPRAATRVAPEVFEEKKTVFTPPLIWDSKNKEDTEAHTIIVASPIFDKGGEVIAAFGFELEPQLEFSQILNAARPGTSGETYGFDAEGLLVSRSRFEDQLRKIGLLPKDPTLSSALHIQVRDPGGNLEKGYEPKLPLRARPLTFMAAEAISGKSGDNLSGYRDYRGVPVVGAWTWIPKLQIGITTEIDLDEAYAGLYSIRAGLLLLLLLLVAGGLGLFLYSVIILRLRSQVDEAKQFGRYQIERRLGQGGMGTVYLGRHALLRRPTAIKVLDSDKAGPENVARFEREVQVSSSLSHPNTIEIYDYGYTPQGTFYYVMELLQGITLGSCISTSGAQPEARVVHILKQACGSLAEAHEAGLIHRDIKPSNLMLCNIGGMLDFVKVLDFGLVRQQAQKEELALTHANTLKGTPLYMSPEAVESPNTMDARSDVYQLGCIGYYLLTGEHVFSGESAVDVLSKHLSKEPESPSDRLGRPVLAELETIILACLAKSPSDRPSHARELLRALEACPVKGHWGQSEARVWWARWADQHPEEASHEIQFEGEDSTSFEFDLWDRKTALDPNRAGAKGG